ncbi:MAG: helix-turn-helix transcriptional regulator [Saprospiraceae bacterium]|nr:helix-turn-helix transcriptional regulator [Saprospiraceae bacterium]
MSLQSILFTISILGVAQGLLLALLIYRNSKAHSFIRKLLSLMFVAWSVAMLLITLVNSGLIQEYPALQAVEYLLGLLVGPFLLIYLRFQKQSDQSLSPILYLHFLPAIIFLLYSIYYLIFENRLPINIIWIMLHIQIYLIYNILYYLQEYKKGYARLKGDWAPLLLLLLAVVGASQWLRFYFSNYESLDLLIPSVASVSFYGITLVGFQRSKLLETSIKATFRMAQSISHQDKIVILEILMNEEKLFQKADLTLNQVAMRLQMHPNQLSALIHQRYNQHFRDFINTYRIEQSKQLLTDTKTALWTIEAIAQESGFQSRSAFYQAFKTIEGITPTEFKKNKMS